MCGTNGLTLADKVPSGGMHPISVTNYKNLVYVLNDGGSGNITGFTLGKQRPAYPDRQFDAQFEQQWRGGCAWPGAGLVQPRRGGVGGDRERH